MSYDFSSQSERFDFPNPYRVENAFFLMAAVVLMGGGILLLLLARSAFDFHSFSAKLPLILGVAMLLHGLGYGARALARLRFFFGRGRPMSLGNVDMKPDQVGATYWANYLRDILRSNSLEFQEPAGPLNGALYSLFPYLIFAPAYIQNVAQRQFQNAIAILVTLLSLIVSVLGSSSEARGWLGIFYFALALFVLIKPLNVGSSGRSGLGLWGLIGLILVAILGPVVLPKLTQGTEVPGWVPGAGYAALIMVAAECAIGLFFLAVINQTRKGPPTASMAVEQGTLTMNSHPKQLMDELERELQKQWVASLPNRRYARVLPEVQVTAEAGSFEGELLEETQPLPSGEIRDLSLGGSFGEPRFRWLAWLNVYGLGMMAIAVIALCAFSRAFITEDGFDTRAVPLAAIGLSFWILGKFSFAAGNFLWGRFEFISKLVWVEMKGNYQSAKMDYGNQFTDRIKTLKNVINVESMTLRVWVAEIETVTFGKDGARFILGMRGLKDEACQLHAHLGNFGAQQSMVVAPTSAVDVQRVEAMSALNRLHENADAAAQALPRAVAQSLRAAAGQADVATGATPDLPAPPTALPAKVPGKCPACGVPQQEGAKFCAECGTRLTSV